MEGGIYINVYRTEQEFWDSCGHFAGDLFKYIELISGDNSWWFKKAYKPYLDKDYYSVIFKSYENPAYKNFVLSVEVIKLNGKYEFKVLKQITDLT